MPRRGSKPERRLRAFSLGASRKRFYCNEGEDILAQAVGAGARGVLLKSDAGKHVVAAIETLLVGGPYLTSVLLERMLRDYPVENRNGADVLTSREESVVKLVAEGHPNKVISGILGLSIKTVETHRAAAMRKLGLSSIADLVRYAIRTKLILP